MKTLTRFAVVGVSGLVLLKLFASVFLPMFGLFLGLIALTVKVAVWAAIGFFLYTLWKQRDREPWTGTD
jgi:hypothetical protein